jgi:uncharacterized protein (DUF1800 family)
MWEDPIVAEVHRTRKKLAEKFDFDVNAIVADIRKRQAALGSRLVSLVKPAEQVNSVNRGPRATPETSSESASAVPGT